MGHSVIGRHIWKNPFAVGVGKDVSNVRGSGSWEREGLISADGGGACRTLLRLQPSVLLQREKVTTAFPHAQNNRLTGQNDNA